MAAAKAKFEDLVDTRIPLFSKDKYSKWVRQIEAECMLRPHAGSVLADVQKDPATKFANLYPDEYAKLPAEARHTEDAIRDDPVQTLKAFLKAVLENRKVPEVVALAAGQPNPNNLVDAAEMPAIPVELKLKLEQEVANWISGEQSIYALVTAKGMCEAYRHVN